MTEQKFFTDVLIVGAGPVGLFAVFACGQQNLRCVVVDVQDQPGGQCAALYPDKPIYDIPSRRAVTGKGLIDALLEQAAPYQPELRLETQVLGISSTGDGGWIAATSDGKSILCRAIFVAGGNGLFQPVRPELPGIENFEGKSVFYSVARPERFAGKRVVIAGGGDSALDWAVALCDVTAKLYLVHRRPRFRGAPAMLARLQAEVAQGKAEILAPCKLSGLLGEAGKLSAVKIRAIAGEEQVVSADILLPLFGLAANIGVLAEWGLAMRGDKILVDPASCATSLPGVYAIGDIADYPGKLGLILTGFAEAAAAAHAAYAAIHPDEERQFMHSTTRGAPAFLPA